MKNTSFIHLLFISFFLITITGCCKEEIWYEDVDGDGLGDSNVSIESCKKPDGYVDNGFDTRPSSALNLHIGDLYQGGYIFHLDSTFEHGLVVQKYQDRLAGVWGCYGIDLIDVPNSVIVEGDYWSTTVGGPGASIGDGATNTNAILALCTEPYIAADICDQYSVENYSDWYLPSINELVLIHEKLYPYKAGFDDAYYWSSSEYDSTRVWVKGFGVSEGWLTDPTTTRVKDNQTRICAIRAF